MTTVNQTLAQNFKQPIIKFPTWRRIASPQCDQYNGLTKDGDYNREIFQHLDCSNLASIKRDEQQNHFSDISDPFPASGLYHLCNEVKIKELAQFQPKNESKFEDELKV